MHLHFHMDRHNRHLKFILSNVFLFPFSVNGTTIDPGAPESSLISLFLKLYPFPSSHLISLQVTSVLSCIFIQLKSLYPLLPLSCHNHSSRLFHWSPCFQCLLHRAAIVRKKARKQERQHTKTQIVSVLFKVRSYFSLHWEWIQTNPNMVTWPRMNQLPLHFSNRPLTPLLPPL